MTTSSEAILREWHETCQAISELASKLDADPGQIGYLKDLQNQAAALEKLHVSLTKAFERDGYESLLQRFAQRIAAIATEFSESPIGQCAEQISAQWALVYSLKAERTLESLREDIERAEGLVIEALKQWCSSRDRKVALERQLDKVRKQASDAPRPMDRVRAEDLEVEVQTEMAGIVRDMRIARDQVFLAVGPSGESFDPTKDYAPTDDLAPIQNPPSKESDKQSSEQGVTAPSEEAGNSASQRTHLEDEKTSQQRPHSDNEPGGAINSGGRETGQIDKVQQEKSPKPADDTTSRTPAEVSECRKQPLATVPSTATAPEPKEDIDAADIGSASPKTSAMHSLWHFLGIGRPGIAYHAARVQGFLNGASRAELAKVIAASMLARHTNADHGEVVNTLGDIISGISPDELLAGGWEDSETAAINVMLFCASLRPALFAPSSGATSLLNHVNFTEALTPLKELSRTVAQQGEWLRQRGVRHSASTLRATPSGTWQETFDSLAMRVREWQDKARAKHNVYPGADRVWRGLLREGGCLKELCDLLSLDDDTSKDRIDRICQQISDRKLFSDLVRKTDRGSKSNRIEGLALKQLWHDVQEIHTLGGEWQQMMDTKPPPSDFLGQRITAFRDELNTRCSEAESAIEHALQREEAEALFATLKLAHAAVRELRQILDGKSSNEYSGIHPSAVQSRDLVLVTDLDIDDNFEPTRPPDQNLLETLLRFESHADSLPSAFAARLERGDLVGARLTLNLITPDVVAEADQLRDELMHQVERRKTDLRRILTDRERKIEHAFCRGQITADDRDDMATNLSELRKVERETNSDDATPKSLRHLTDAFSKVSKIDGALASSSAESIERARARLQVVSKRRVDDNAKSFVMSAIEAGDLLTANEGIARIERGESVVPTPLADNPFWEFLATLDEIERVASNMTRPKLKLGISQRENIGKLSLAHLDDSAISGAIDLLDAWYEVERTKQPKEHTLKRLFKHFGFKVIDVSREQIGRGWSCANVGTALLEDRVVCPSRQFGSEAAGRYRVLLNWDTPADEAILRPIEDGGLVPTLILHFGYLGSSRERLRVRAVQTHRLFLVVDEALMLFLATRPSGRLAALFRCSLPFSSAAPYATTSSVVPPELFYGRKRERQAIMDQSGSCFIYGGRQLGKTALLRSVERDFNRSSSSQARVAKWIDLKANEIGYQLGPNDIWPLLQRELRSLKLTNMGRSELDPGVDRQVKTFLGRIRKWLDEQKDRRLLLLLDEADEFLKRDAETDFRESARLKLLMDETERRFKVVFAGLHNVLRTTQQANHPLAHLGDPIRIGAMLSNGEEKEAQALVWEPLEAIGCRFQRPELSTRVLAQTNYFPSLIQLYGAELVHRLRDSAKTFPYEITDADIDNAYASRELRSAIRERFLLTLQLDPRYEVIAYSLAFELHEGDLGEGVEGSALLDLSQNWWPSGFDGLPDVEFDMLLHEMEGLGVLRELGDKRYTLRNPNILQLLGNSEDIAKALSRPRTLPIVFEAKSFRARYPEDRPSNTRRGPLTYSQESDLRRGGVAVISGCQAVGVENVQEFLSSRIGGELFQLLDPVGDKAEFEEQLKIQRPPRNEVTVYLLPSEVNWDATWLSAARSILKRKAGGGRLWSRVAFIADPETLWSLLRPSMRSDLAEVDWIDLVPCDEAFLRRWLDDINATADDVQVSKLLEATGGWPRALDHFSEHKRANRPLHLQIERTLNLVQQESSNWLQEGFGLSREVEDMLRKVAEADDPFDAESIELVGSEHGLDPDELQRRVKWCTHLGLIETIRSGGWSFNPLVKRLLQDNTSG